MSRSLSCAHGAVRSLCCLGLLLLSGGTVAAQAETADQVGEAAGNRLKLKTEKVIVFKNGYALVVKRGRATTNATGELFLDEVPEAAILGSFWATAKQGKLLSTTAGWVNETSKSEQEVRCLQTIEILQANRGKLCSLVMNDGSSLEGKIAEVLARPNPVTLPAPAVNLRSSFRQPPVLTADRLNGNQFVLKTEAGDVLVAASNVRRLMLPEMKTTRKQTVTSKSRHKRLTFRFAESGKQQELLVMYFRPGIRWIPTYRINLRKQNAGQGKHGLAEVAMQAEIINEAEDLYDMPTDIVVGVPNFRFRDSVSPLVLESSLRRSMQQAAPQLMQQFRNDFSNSSYSQAPAAARRAAAAANDNTRVNLPGELTASGKQDLFVYSLPKLRLGKGERAAVPVVSTSAKYKDIYTWDLQIKRHHIAASPSALGIKSPLMLAQNEVWRQIELTNNTRLPWTTGAAMLMQGQQPLAQEILTYTSAKEVCRIPVTVSVETRGSFSEKEVARQLQALTWSNRKYAKLTQRATLDLCNNKSHAIDAEITFRFGGKAISASHNGAITLQPYRAEDWQRYRGEPAVNNSSMVKWNVTLKPGETFMPTVDYYYYVLH